MKIIKNPFHNYITLVICSFITLLLTNCAPRVLYTKPQNIIESDITEEYAPFAIIEKDTINRESTLFIAEMRIKDAGLSIDCDYNTLLKIAEKKARGLGGNCIVIKEHILPDWKSSCDRITFDILVVDNPNQYEKLIEWNINRKLEITDFKGSTENRPFQAATYSSIHYIYSGNPNFNTGKVSISTRFDCQFSYFKLSNKDTQVLSHEQLHFDISEIYARKFRKRISEEIHGYRDFISKHQTIFSEVYKELSLKQDEYDSEVYINPPMQGKWKAWVFNELDLLRDYTTTSIVLKK
jgi:hypothetical protein